MRPSDEEIMAVIRAKPGLTTSEIMSEFGIEATTVNRSCVRKAIQSLKSYRFIESVDEAWPTRWKEYGVAVNVKEREKPLTHKCREHELSYDTVIHRIKRGWSEEKALTTPIMKNEKKVKE